MDITKDIDALERHLEDLAKSPDEALLDRYAMQRPKRPPGFYWQLRWVAGRILRWFHSVGILPANTWPVSLAHSSKHPAARPVLIWAVGVDRSTLRGSAAAWSKLLSDMPEFAPVLVTDVADFAFFSRLGWLVEYVPTLRGSGEAFEGRKARFLARLYRGAPALPLHAGLASGKQLEALCQRLARPPSAS